MEYAINIIDNSLKDTAQQSILSCVKQCPVNIIDYSENGDLGELFKITPEKDNIYSLKVNNQQLNYINISTKNESVIKNFCINSFDFDKQGFMSLSDIILDGKINKTSKSFDDRTAFVYNDYIAGSIKRHCSPYSRSLLLECFEPTSPIIFDVQKIRSMKLTFHPDLKILCDYKMMIDLSMEYSGYHIPEILHINTQVPHGDIDSELKILHDNADQNKV